MRHIPVLLAVTFAVGSVPDALAGSPFRFPVGKYDKGELKYVDDVPVLIVTGSPKEIGEQIGMLAIKPMKPWIDEMADGVFRGRVGDVGRAVLANFAGGVYKKFPPEYREEIEAMARAGGIDPELLIIGNTIGDLEPGLRACSGLAVESARSETGGSLLGRNNDVPPFGRIAEFGLVIVYRPDGKLPFAMMTIPGALMCGSGMNAAGLAFGSNSVYESADGSPSFNADGVPTLVAGRQLLEEGRTVADAEKWLRAHPPMIRGIVPICDRTTAAVLEVTPKTVSVRGSEKGLVYCTNHFRADDLRVGTDCRRYVALTGAEKQDRFGVTDVAKLLHAANQGAATLHTMVFETGPLKMHVSFGDGKKSATERPLIELELKDLLKP